MEAEAHSSWWTDSRCAKLEELWRDGQSATQIFLELRAKSRNAVIGKISRLGLTGVGGSVVKPRQLPRRTYPANRKRPANSMRVTPVERVETEILEPVSKKITIHNLTNHICKWPGDEDGPPFTYCGNDRFGDGPYCEYHRSIAYVARATQRDFDNIATRTMAGRMHASKTFIAE